MRLQVLYGALPARDEAGYNMQGHRQEAWRACGKRSRQGMQAQISTRSKIKIKTSLKAPPKVEEGHTEHLGRCGMPVAVLPVAPCLRPVLPDERLQRTSRRTALLAPLAAALLPAPTWAQRRCRCTDCGQRLSCSEAVSRVSQRQLRFLFFSEGGTACTALQQAAAALREKAKGRFRASQLVEEVFPARMGALPVAGCSLSGSL